MDSVYDSKLIDKECSKDNPVERDTDFELRVEMAKELQEMGLQAKSIERILSIRLTSDQSHDLSRG